METGNAKVGLAESASTFARKPSQELGAIVCIVEVDRSMTCISGSLSFVGLRRVRWRHLDAMVDIPYCAPCQIARQGHFLLDISVTSMFSLGVAEVTHNNRRLQ